jgi:hypothetical protein
VNDPVNRRLAIVKSLQPKSKTREQLRNTSNEHRAGNYLYATSALNDVAKNIGTRYFFPL